MSHYPLYSFHYKFQYISQISPVLMHQTKAIVFNLFVIKIRKNLHNPVDYTITFVSYVCRKGKFLKIDVVSVNKVLPRLCGEINIESLHLNNKYQ